MLLAELTDARDRMLAGETYLPRVRLERCRAIERVLVAQVDVIDTMTPQAVPVTKRIAQSDHSSPANGDARLPAAAAARCFSVCPLTTPSAR